ncbi:ABC transporter permease [Pseudoflavonifractor capillosus]|uniref:methionine ABC transporter permease n=1 Tax=Pseudoflavonifractor capillosus TaxID=106588 RepID=UPI0019585D85|nr:methionine ABC transporter permease [Pseudoflavonifractor capillosus]MBM6896792.1 ABC transporter permease [Pseudoflavonifractor capillosus]
MDKFMADLMEVFSNEKYLQEFLTGTWETLYSTILATLVAYALGLILGVLLVVGEENGVLPLPRPVMKALNVVINILRSVPFLILMIIVLPLSKVLVGTQIGTIASIPPLVIAAAPFVARLVEASLREMDKGVLEAAQAMGCTPFQIIRKVLLPECLPSLISGFTTSFITILSYGAMSGAIGGGGLGKIAINYGYYRYQPAVMLVAVVLIVILVQIFQSLGTYFAVSLDRRITNKRSKAAGKKHRAEKAGLQ